MSSLTGSSSGNISLGSVFQQQTLDCSPKSVPVSQHGDRSYWSETELLNAQAENEFGLLKSRLINATIETNKFLDQDDQIVVKDHKLCVSLSFRRRLFVMEFRQTVSTQTAPNHSLEFIFKGAIPALGIDGHITLVLGRERNQNIWTQSNEKPIGLLGTNKALVGLVLRWLQSDNTVFLSRQG
jgi:hypothetical protein